MAQEGVITVVVNHANIEQVTQPDPFNKECVVCLEALKGDVESGDTVKVKEVLLSCGHMYHDECIRSVILSQVKSNSQISCPICRFVYMECDNEAYKSARREMFINEIRRVNEPYGTHNMFLVFVRMILLLFIFSCGMFGIGFIIYFMVPNN